MKSDSKKTPLTSLKIFKPQISLQKMSFPQYDDEPTIMMVEGNRELNKGKNTQQKRKNQNHQLRTPRLTTYESNLIESSPSRSLPSETDGEFVCNYLTPIKKQQFHKLLFKDGVIESPENKTKQKCQSQKQNKKKIEGGSKTNNNNILQKNNSNFCGQMKSCEMVQSFFPYDTFNNNNIQQPSCLKNSALNLQKQCSCQFSNKPNVNHHTGIFIDPYSQINFLKLNNHDLFAKLQKEIEKNVKLQSQIDKLVEQNKNLIMQNTHNQQKIKDLQKVLKKYETQRGNYLAKQWEQFHLVKQMLIQKKRSKSKAPFQRVQKQAKQQQTLIDLSKLSTLNDKNMDSTSTICMNFTNNNKNSALQIQTVNSQFKNSSQLMKERKCTKISIKQNGSMQRFLKDKLSVFISSQNSKQNHARNLEPCRNQNKQNVLNENRKRSKTLKSKKCLS